MTSFVYRFRAGHLVLALALALLAGSCAEYGECPEGRIADYELKVCYIPCPDGQVDDERHETCTPIPPEAGMDGATSSRTDNITSRDAADAMPPSSIDPSIDGGSSPTPPAEPDKGDKAAPSPPPMMNDASPVGPMSCAPSPIADGCCPSGANALTDPDCPPRCGNGKTEAGETCDGENCPNCSSDNACVIATPTGTASECTAKCELVEVTACRSGDGCCPASCTHATDTDCSASCGDGVVTGSETCEPMNREKPCRSSCDDGNACTKDIQTGSAQQCNVACTHMSISMPTSGDQCCPPGANANNDTDCRPFCGNEVRESGETCDGDCQSSCDDGNACTTEKLVGDPGKCSAMCSASTPITAAKSGDGCCPEGANANTDRDCSATCGNGVREGSETCDGDCPESPTDCDDSNVCTRDSVAGNANNCTASCRNMQIERPARECNDNKPCTKDVAFPSDTSCTYECRHEPIERPARECNDNKPCTKDVAFPSDTSCTYECRYEPIETGVQNACGGCGALPVEDCDGQDDDCDGEIDEGVKNACGGCGTGPGCEIVGNYTVMPDSVIDNAKGLHWQRNVPPPHVWRDAREYCSALGDGWRLPSQSELQSIMDRTRGTPPLIDGAVFPDTPAESFWTANDSFNSGDPPSPDHAWDLDFRYGSPSWRDKNATARVRCVRYVR